MAAVALWARSYWVSHAVLYANRGGEYGVQSLSGMVVFASTDWAHARPTLRWDRYDGSFPAVWDSPPSIANRLGFGHRFRSVAVPPDSAPNPPPAVRQRMLFVPFWFIAVLFACPSAYWLRLRRRRRWRQRQGRCYHCGYDLQGNASGVCPECGRRVSET